MKRLAELALPGVWIVVFCLYLAGLTLMLLSPALPGVKPWIASTWSIPAAYGGFMAILVVVRQERARRFLRMNATMPMSMMVDAASGTATATLLNGEMVSIQIPEEILEEGPEAVMDYCAREFEQEQ